MSLVALGINHQTAPVEVRERLVFGPDDLFPALRELSGLPSVTEAAILSTCNRTELYCGLAPAVAYDSLIDWLNHYHSLADLDIRPYLYLHRDQEAIRHVLRVACGLDSLILGEPQILGQIKSAYSAARDAGVTHAVLERLFQHAFAVAKQVRTETQIGANPISVAFAAVALARQIFGDLRHRCALMIGAGETIELATKHLHTSGIERLIVANRSIDRARQLVAPFNGEAIGIPEIPDRLPEADIVISSTASPLPILGKGATESALKRRKHRPMFMVDLAVPRDIEPEVSDLADVYLYTVDDLEDVIEENRRSRQQAAGEAEQIIELQVEDFSRWLRAQGLLGTLKNFRDGACRTRDEVLTKARRMVAAGKSPEETLEFLANTLTNKLIHHPTVQLNKAAHDGREELLLAARELLGLPKD